jgi:excisionase family DNA binding protein
MNNVTLTGLNLPAKHEIEIAMRSQRELAAFLSTKFDTQQITIKGEDDVAHSIELPTSALTMLMEVLGELAAGNAVQIVPVHAELTTQEAANILNVSRPHLVKLLEEGQLPHHKAGRHRRVLFSNLMAYKKKRDAASLAAMQELATQAQELGLGY